MDGKGYLLNEPGAQPPSFYGDFSCKEEPEVDRPGGKKSLDPLDFSEKGEPCRGWERAGGLGWGAAEAEHLS